MTSIEQQILNFIQDGFPIAERPYAVIAEKIASLDSASVSSVTEQSVFDVVENLRASGVIRRIGGVYDSRKLGFVSRLVAGKVPASEIDFSEPREGRAPTAMEKFAEAVMGIPAITHNYVRSHDYNVWFTVIAESEDSVLSIIRQLEASTELHDVHCLPATRMFKINTVMGQNSKSESRGPCVSRVQCASYEPVAGGTKSSAANVRLSDSDKLRIRLLCGDIPHSLTPFADVFTAFQNEIRTLEDPCDTLSSHSRKSLWSPAHQRLVIHDSPCGDGNLKAFLAGICEDLASKRMRRFGAVLRHQKAGFAHNAMVCFDVRGLCNGVDVADENLVAEVGKILASNPHISHCYERPPFEGFPYNVYAMFHASTSEDLELSVVAAVQALTAKINDVPYSVLRSIRELKKTSFQFFA